MTKKKGTTDKGRTILSTNTEFPKSITHDKDVYYLWKFAKTLNPEEISFLITKRKQDLKFIKDPVLIKKIRFEISILVDTFRIVSRLKSRDDEE